MCASASSRCSAAAHISIRSRRASSWCFRTGSSLPKATDTRRFGYPASSPPSQRRPRLGPIDATTPVAFGGTGPTPRSRAMPSAESTPARSSSALIARPGVAERGDEAGLIRSSGPISTAHPKPVEGGERAGQLPAARTGASPCPACSEVVSSRPPHTSGGWMSPGGPLLAGSWLRCAAARMTRVVRCAGPAPRDPASRPLFVASAARISSIRTSLCGIARSS
jgi:hypothetical protein